MKIEAIGSHSRVLITKTPEGWFVQRRMELHLAGNNTNDGYASFALQSNFISDPKHVMDPSLMLFTDEIAKA